MSKRQRIRKITKSASDFESNCASDNARLLHKYTEFEVELWIDKHYQNRLLHGDENGKRDGISEEDVQELIIKAFKYLLDTIFDFHALNSSTFLKKARLQPEKELF